MDIVGNRPLCGAARAQARRLWQRAEGARPEVASVEERGYGHECMPYRDHTPVDLENTLAVAAPGPDT